MDALQESYLGGILVGVISTLILQMSWGLIKEIVNDIGMPKVGQAHAKNIADKKSA